MKCPHFKIGDRVRVPDRLRGISMPDLIKFMGDGRSETITEVELFEHCQSGQRVSVDLFPPRLDAFWFELAE